MANLTPIFDGHNDVLLRLFNKQIQGAERLFLEGEDDGQLDHPRAVKGGFAGGMFAIYIPSKGRSTDKDELMGSGHYDFPLPGLMSAQELRICILELATMSYRGNALIRLQSGRMEMTQCSPCACHRRRPQRSLGWRKRCPGCSGSNLRIRSSCGCGWSALHGRRFAGVLVLDVQQRTGGGNMGFRSSRGSSMDEEYQRSPAVGWSLSVQGK